MVIGFVLFHHYWSISHVPPVMDGSEHVAAIGNLGLLLNGGEWTKYFSDLALDGNNFLSNFYFSLFSAVIGPGRIAWGWGWVVAVILLTVSCLRLCRDRRIPFILALAFLILASPLIEREGGILNQRVDGFSVLILIVMLTAMLNKRWTVAAFLTFFAVLAKGVALPICLIAWSTAFLTKIVQPKELFIELKTYKTYWITVAILSFCYSWAWLRPVINYNLLALRNSHSESHSMLSLVQANLIPGLQFYLKSLLNRNILTFVLCGTSILIIGKSYKQTEINRRILNWGLLFFLGTLCIFSSHPVLSSVLLVWMTPCIYILGFALASTIVNKWQPNQNQLKICVVILALFSGGFIGYQNYGRNLFSINLKSFEQWNQVRRITNEISTIILSSKTLSHLHPSQKDLYLYPNFLVSIASNFELNYDVFRVLIFERLGKKSPYLRGWELGTRSDNWRAEISANGANIPALALLLYGEKVKVFPYHPIGLISNLVKTSMDLMKCTPEKLSDLDLKNMGTFLVYSTNATMSQCGFPK